ncbi:MAG: HDIG domain-containing metalloprotein [Candidatus Margulisiibacteriota bacterium]
MAGNGIAGISWARQHAQAMYRKLSNGAGGVQRVDRGLLPYLNPDHPLLLEMEGRMPGTYRHSIIVGSLAAIATAHIGGDTDLARAIGYNHDTGKLRDPELFGEAKAGDRASLSAIDTEAKLRTILDHPLASREYAEDHGLPEEMRVLLPQHHGDGFSRVRLSEDLSARLPIGARRYPGPRPATKEIALVMYADCLQACVDGLMRKTGWPAEPSAEHLRGIVDTIGEELQAADQLANSTLTGSELNIAAERFTTWLFRFYHRLDVTGTPQGEGPLNDERLTFPSSRR